ncbi:permease [Anaeromicropila populeti]|uniref:Predicted permease n=1 Tax=Anaeromicropila populeti TaxID=37658 RepID=A0A1I6K9E7_9FIRM|nr:permease [Anaeromicropila populeti]SFR87817.1 Predicted permease [Anaeromicropila populeti]
MKKIISLLKSNLLPIISVAAFLVIFIVSPEKGEKIAVKFKDTCIDTIPILLLMFALLAFIKVAMDSDVIKNTIEKSKGVKSVLFAYMFGMLVSGPIYPGYSLGNMLIKKGMQVRVVVIMLSVWATLKIPLLPFEVKALGIKLTAVRWIVTAISIFFMALLSEKMLKVVDNKGE